MSPLPLAPRLNLPPLPGSLPAGTPVQNNMRELFGIMNLVDEDKFEGGFALRWVLGCLVHWWCWWVQGGGLLTRFCRFGARRWVVGC